MEKEVLGRHTRTRKQGATFFSLQYGESLYCSGSSSRPASRRVRPLAFGVSNEINLELDYQKIPFAGWAELLRLAGTPHEI